LALLRSGTIHGGCHVELVEFICGAGRICDVDDIDEALVGCDCEGGGAFGEEGDECWTGGEGDWREGAEGTEVVDLDKRIWEWPALSTYKIVRYE
jgi:hypothetical protein